MSRWLCLLAVTVVSGSGVARAEAPGSQLAIGTNPPVGWLEGSVGVSGYVQLAERDALRLNVATYSDPHYVLAALAAASAGDGGGGAYGRVIDVGVGWDWYSRRFLDGFSTELGALYRKRDNHDYYDGLGVAYAWNTQVIAARATIGWTWRLGSVFASFAIGASMGVEHGTKVNYDPFGGSSMPPTSHAVNAEFTDLESYVRLGYVFRP